MTSTRRRPLVVRMYTVRVVDEQVGALDHLDAHRLREEGVLEECGVVDAGREQHDGRLLREPRRAVAQHAEQILRVALDRPDVVVREDLRPHAFEHAPVLDHVRHARGRAQVVLEDEEATASRRG